MYFSLFVHVPEQRFAFEAQGRRVAIPVVSSQPLTLEHAQVRALFVMIHGGGLSANNYFNRGMEMLRRSRLDEDAAWVMAPQFLEPGVGVEEEGLLIWGPDWRGGSYSLPPEGQPAQASLGSYQVLDRLLLHVAEHCPNLEQVTVLGHSAGGQFVGRYAAAGDAHEALTAQGIQVRYVVANPSSYVYLDSSRLQVADNGTIGPADPARLAACPEYDDYKYGLKNPYGSIAALTPDIVRQRLLSREIIFLLGTADTKRGWGLASSCPAELQGRNRLERGRLYRAHLQSFAGGKDVPGHRWLELPDIGHDSGEMFTHPEFIKVLDATRF